MNNEVLYTARRTMLSQRFVGCCFGSILMLALGVALAVITKSFGIGTIAALILMVIFILVLLFEGLSRRACVVEFYKDRYVIKSGLLNKKESTMRLNKVLAVNVDITFFGSIFKYGNVHLDVVGKNDAVLGGVKNPRELKNFLENTMANTNYDNVHEVVSE
ncbi:MAG: PH domain-containing protein [Anaeroplasmataceae bacterium]